MKIKQQKPARWIYFSYILLMVFLCVLGAALPHGQNDYNRGATLYYPEADSEIGTTIMVNGSAYAKDGIDSAALVFMPTGEAFPIQWETITHKGETLLKLSTFKNEVNINSEGPMDVQVKIITKTGETHVIDVLPVTIKADAPVKAFEMFSLQHFLSVLVVAGVYFLMLYFYRAKPVPNRRLLLFAIISLMVMVGDITLKTWLISKGLFRASVDMSLHMCDISGFLLPVLLFMKPGKTKDTLFNLMFIWGLGGAGMALLTPEMGGYVFPSLYYIIFFVKHGMIVVGVLMVIFVDGLRPNIKKMPKAILISFGIVVLIYGINQLVAFLPPYDVGNYMFLSYPPTGGSLIDALVQIFGPSPYYIAGLVLVGAIVYAVLWVPFAIGGAIKKH